MQIFYLVSVGGIPMCKGREIYEKWKGFISNYYTIFLEEGMATHSSILAWIIPWTEEPGGQQSMGSQRVRRD